MVPGEFCGVEGAMMADGVAGCNGFGCNGFNCPVAAEPGVAGRLMWVTPARCQTAA